MVHIEKKYPFASCIILYNPNLDLLKRNVENLIWGG